MRTGTVKLLLHYSKVLPRNTALLHLNNTLKHERSLTSGRPPFKKTPPEINIEIDNSFIDRISSCIPKSACDTHSKTPNLQEIKQSQEDLVEKFRTDKGFIKDVYDLLKPSRGRQFGINYEVPKEWDDPFGRSLFATTLLSALGLVPVLNKRNEPLFGEVVSGVGEVLGHQDTILKDDKLVLVEHLAIINLGGSTSDCLTWFKRNDDIVSQLKRDFPSSYYILKTINFTSKDNNKTQPIIGNDDELNFIDHSSCLPLRQDLINYGILDHKILEAKLNLNKVINSLEGRQNFLLKDEGDSVSQVVCLRNWVGYHGRQSGGGERNAIALALEKNRISIPGSSISGR